MYEPPAGLARQNCEFETASVYIRDARPMAASCSIDVQGFELRDAPSSICDFTDKEAVETRYYHEAAELAKFVTGADQAVIFDHQVRHREAGRPKLTFGRSGNAHVGAVGRVHNDYSEASGQRRFEIVVADQGVCSEISRFAIVNIWRSIGGRILDTPLAVCDARTVSTFDLITTDLIYPERKGEFYLLTASRRHDWMYFGEMDRTEALVFKQYDSQVSGVARFTPHTAFDLPEIPSNAPLRQSIEIRCLVLFR
jgi:hypothetical protein